MINPLADLLTVCGAERPDDLWRWLVTVPGTVDQTDTSFAEVAFGRLHRDEPEDAWRTAALLCTDSRWRNVARRLVRAIEASGLVDEEHLGELAVAFTVDDDYLWEVPDVWLADGTVVVGEPMGGGESPPTIVVARPIPPPLRRWGADRAVRHGHLDVGEALDAVAVLPARAGDQVLLGLLDAGPALTPGARDAIIELGVTWTSGTVRLGALEQLAARDGPDAAALRAARDRNAKIRRWGAGLVRADHRQAGRRHSREAATESAADVETEEPPAQASLFDD